MAETPVTVIEANTSAWDETNQGFGGLEDDTVDLGQYDEHHSLAYGSPYKVLPDHSNTTTPTPMHRQLSHNITPIQSPISHSAPSSMSKRNRSVTGLGTPSGVHRSAKRIRQVTYDAGSYPSSPSAQRRRVDPNASLTTSQPLSRATSATGPFLRTSSFTQDRVVSTASNMTASTSYEVMSPSQSAFPHYGMIPSVSLPELIGSQHPSPNMSNGLSPVCTPQQQSIVYYSSPVEDQGGFHMDSQQSTGIMEQTEQFLGLPGSLPGSISMQSVASFSALGHGQYRQGTLSTIVETPLMGQDGSMGYQTGYIPQQPVMPSQHFDPTHYPQVPGMNISYGPSSSHTTRPDINAWSAQTYNVSTAMGVHHSNPNYGYSQAPIPHPGPPQRHASAGYIAYQPNNMSVRGFPGMQGRSISESFIPTMPSMTGLPTSMTTGGLFGPAGTVLPSEGESSMMSRMASYDSSSNIPIPVPPLPAYNIGHHTSSAAPSTTTSPDTPRKRQAHPIVGKRLRPGPKPKKTPTKGKRSDGSSPDSAGISYNLPIIGQLQVNIQNQGQGSSQLSVQGRHGLGSIDPTVLLGNNGSGSGGNNGHLPSLAEDDESTPSPTDSPKPPTIIFGPDLSTISRPVPAIPQLTNPTLLQIPNQPQLTIQPPRSNISTNEGPSTSGLPREFLEKLYATFHTMEGSTNGQPVKRFRCLIEGCNRHFPRKSAIHSHIQTHLEDKPFVCQEGDCCAAFVRQHDLRRHVRIHSGTKPFPCPW